MCVKHLFAKHAFLGDLGECHHLEIATLRLHLGSGRQRCKYSAKLLYDCSIRILFPDCSIRVYQFPMNKTCYGHSVLRTT